MIHAGVVDLILDKIYRSLNEELSWMQIEVY